MLKRKEFKVGSFINKKITTQHLFPELLQAKAHGKAIHQALSLLFFEQCVCVFLVHTRRTSRCAVYVRELTASSNPVPRPCGQANQAQRRSVSEKSKSRSSRVILQFILVENNEEKEGGGRKEGKKNKNLTLCVGKRRDRPTFFLFIISAFRRAETSPEAARHFGPCHHFTLHTPQTNLMISGSQHG